jgi:hypothetical protein
MEWILLNKMKTFCNRPKECHEATVPTKVPGDVKAECGDLEVVYVKSVDCPSGIADFRLFHFPIFCL